MKIAVIGCGSIGSRHIRNLIALGVPAEDIVACDRRHEALSAQPDGVVCFLMSGDFGFAPQDFGALLICTPAVYHALWMKVAIRARVPFFVEKPATLGVHELTEAEWQTDVPHLVGYNLRFHHQAAHLKTLRPTGGILTLDCDMQSWPGRAYGPPLFECSHEVDLALWMGAPSASVEVVGRELQLGPHWSVTINHESRSYRRRWKVWSAHTGRDVLFEEPGDLGEQMYVDEMAHFLRVVRRDEASRCTLREAKRVVEICEAATVPA